MASIYTIPGRMEALMQTLFGLMLAVAIYFTLNSAFLAVLVVAVLCYIPIDPEALSEKVNGIGFAILMTFILFWGFGVGASYLPDLGLGIDIGAPVTNLGLGLILTFIGVSTFISFISGQRTENAESAAMTFGITILLIVLGIAAFVFLQPWNWNVSAVIFAAIWGITYANGVFGGIEGKQVVGIIMVIITFVIYTLGVGSDVVGAAAFGQWWPPVKDFGKQTLGPVKDAFTDMFKSFKEAVKLITCPTCAARDILTGIYANPTGKGKTGAFGLEFEELSVPDGKIILGRPFSVNLGIKNQGAADAKDVQVSLKIDDRIIEGLLKPSLKFYQEPLPPEDARQIVSVGEMNCGYLKNLNIVKEYSDTRKSLEEKAAYLNITKEAAQAGIQDYIFPITATAEYNYKIDSQLPMEFISSAERERLLKDKKLERRKEKSTMTTSPLALSMFVDIDQPIEAGTRFYLGVEAKAQERDGKAKNVIVEVKLPKEFITATDDESKNTQESYKITGAVSKTIDIVKVAGNKDTFYLNTLDGTLTWNAGDLVGVDDENEKQGIFNKKRIFLDFSGKNLQEKIKTTKTFSITASSDFAFTKERKATVKFEFGGYCCAGETIRGQCFSGEKCYSINDANDRDLGTCKAGPAITAVAPDPTAPGGKDYCDKTKNKNLIKPEEKCLKYEGGCKTPEECLNKGKGYEPDPTLGVITCITDWTIPAMQARGIGVCCYSNQPENCMNNFLDWLKNKQG